MADKTVRKLTPEPEFDELVNQFNKLRDDLKNQNLVALAHEDNNVAAVTAADAIDLATSITLANACKATYNTHRAKTDAHQVADATNVTTAADATDLTTVGALANELKTDINAHMAQAGVHRVNDTNTVTAANFLTTQAEANTLLNDVKAKLNAHMARTFSSQKLVRGRA